MGAHDAYIMRHWLVKGYLAAPMEKKEGRNQALKEMGICLTTYSRM